MRLCQLVFAVAIVFLATPSIAEPSHGSRLCPMSRIPDNTRQQVLFRMRPSKKNPTPTYWR